MSEARKPHSIRAALEDYLAGLRGLDSNLSLGAAEDLGEKALADLDGLLEQLRSAETTLAHAEAFIEHQDMSYRWAEWCEGRDPKTKTIRNAHLYVEGEEFVFSSLDGVHWLPVTREGRTAEDAAQLAGLFAGDGNFKPMTFHRDYLTAKGATFDD